MEEWWSEVTEEWGRSKSTGDEVMYASHEILWRSAIPAGFSWAEEQMKTGFWDEIDNDGNHTCAGLANCGRHEVIDGLTWLESDYRIDDAGPTVPAKHK